MLSLESIFYLSIFITGCHPERSDMSKANGTQSKDLLTVTAMLIAY